MNEFSSCLVSHHLYHRKKKDLIGGIIMPFFGRGFGQGFGRHSFGRHGFGRHGFGRHGFGHGFGGHGFRHHGHGFHRGFHRF